MSPSLATRGLGEGPPVMFVHGGVGPGPTWKAQEELRRRWRLVIVTRRGFRPSPAVERQDFELDAGDLAQLLAREPAHCVGFSYGAVGLALAAGKHPERIRSLTLIEPPLFAVASDDPRVSELIRLSAAYTGTDDAPREEAREAFERLAGIDAPRAEFAEGQELAVGLRPPWEAEPDFAAIRAAGVPSLVFSGDHDPGVETVCNALAEHLGADRERLPGAGHAVQRAAGFNARLERFLFRAER